MGFSDEVGHLLWLMVILGMFKGVFRAMRHTREEVRHFLGRVRFHHVRACAVQNDIQDYMAMLEPCGKLRIEPEACELGF